MVMLSRSTSVLRPLRRRTLNPSHLYGRPDTMAACMCSAAKPSPWDMDLRPKQASDEGGGAAAADRRQYPERPKRFSQIVSRELAEALNSMEVHAPNQMQAVRCHRHGLQSGC